MNLSGPLCSDGVRTAPTAINARLNYLLLRVDHSVTQAFHSDENPMDNETFRQCSQGPHSS